MKVLLISPVRELDPPCGDITYTEILVKHPPAGVEYETYDAALRRGALVEHAKRSRLRNEPLLTLANKGINLLRNARVLFWEPFRFFSVKPGEYDLVHLHVFNARFLGLDVPLVVSSGAPQRDLYRNYRRYSAPRVAAMERAEQVLGRTLRMNCNSYRMPQADRVWVYTEYFRDFLADQGYVPRDRIAVIPIMSATPAAALVRREPRRIGFVARDFRRKGGEVVLAAFAKVRAAAPGAELWIVGSPPELSADECARRGITWLPVVERERLLGEIMPGFDVFAYPTPHDCFSYVMLEAMSSGCAIATSDYVSMPEAVDYGRAGMISRVGDPDGLAQNILRLLDPQTNWDYRQAARQRFEKHFSCEAVAPRMLAEYQRAIAGRREAVPA